MRKGRFDETFFVDLPGAETRAQLFALHLRKRGLGGAGAGADAGDATGSAGVDLAALAAANEGFSGAEIEQAIVSALYAVHASGTPLSQFALRAELRRARPLSVLMAEQVEGLREWARGRTVSAD